MNTLNNTISTKDKPITETNNSISTKDKPIAETNNNISFKEDKSMPETAKTLTVREALERLDILRDPKARVAEVQRERRAYEAAFNDYAIRGITQNALKREPESAGGYLVPDTMESRIVDKLNEQNVLRRICNVIRTTQNINMPVIMAHGEAFWVPEGGTLPLSDDQFSRALIGAYKLATSEVISSELLEDSVVDVEELIENTFATRIAEAEEDAFLNGDGNGKPVGLLTQASVGAVSETAGAVSLDDVINLIHSVQSVYRSKGVLLMNDITLAMLFKTKNAYDRSVWLGDMQHAVTDQVFGYPIVISDAMPDPESGNKPIAFGDFNHFWIGDRGRHHLKRLDERRANTDQVEFILTKRVDAKLIVAGAIKTLEVA